MTLRSQFRALFAVCIVLSMHWTFAAAQQPPSAATATIHGIVRHARTSEPIAGARITLAEGTGYIPTAYLPRSLATLTSNAKGEFAFEKLKAGSYKVIVMSNGYVRRDSARITLAEGQSAKDMVFALTPTGTAIDLQEGGELRGIDFTGGEVGSFDIVLSSKVASVEGTVTSNRLTGVQGAQVVLVPDQSRHMRELFKIARTDQDGRFNIPNVPPGDYKLYAWEAIEPFAWFDLDLAKRWEQFATPVHLMESGKKSVGARLIPAGSQ